jgi:glycosyltransferase involved in cell wall biosynthesis
MEGPRLSVVVPVYNEARVLEANLERLSKELHGLGLDFELVCVDDGSRDESPEVLSRLAGPALRALSHEGNRGKGAAVRTGCLAARGERIVFMDADLSTDLAALRPMLAALDNGAAVALGTRRAPAASIAVRQPKAREYLGRAFSRLAAWLVHAGVRDFTCGFKGFTRDAAQRIFSRATIDRWAFDAELVAIARAQRLEIVEIPVRWEHRGGSKVRVSSAAMGSLIDLGRIVARRASGRYR